MKIFYTIRRRRRRFISRFRLWGTGQRREYLANKEMARTIVTEKVRNFSRKYGVEYGTIAIRNQKTRWGSCSKKGNLNFSYRIVFLPPELQDYLVVHEVCHLKEFNHSRAFWDLVAREVPNYRELRRKLRGLDR